MTLLSNILIIDDHPLFRAALRSTVEQAFENIKAIEATSIDEAIDLLECGRECDIALVDLNIPGVSGFDGLLRLRSNYPRLPIIIVSGLEVQHIVDEALLFGAAGFVPKSAEGNVLADAITTVMAGGVYVPFDYQTNHSTEKEHAHDDADSLAERVASLTPQQLRVLSMLREGLLNKQIAYELQVGNSTIKKHVSEILRKLNVHSRTQAVIEVAKLDKDRGFKSDKDFL